MVRKEVRRRGPSFRAVGATMLASVLLPAGGAGAASIDTGNPDVEIRWDNTVRYNVGMRANGRDSKIGNDPNNQSSDYKFDRGDIVTNRVDLLSEFDATFYKKYGFRVSGAAWYDHAYRGANAGTNPGTLNTALGPVSYASIGAYPDGRYTDSVRRYYRGPSGELLDAFAFGGFELGNVPVNVKIGQHNIYWGESLFSFIHGVSYSQGPVDIRKAFSIPGSEAKELFMPLNQLSAQAQISDELSIAGQLLFDWKPSRLPEGGTYLDVADFLFSGGGTRSFAFRNPLTGRPMFIPIGKADEPNKFGDFGLSARWSPQWLDGTMGFYYRKFDEKLPWTLAGKLVPTGVPLGIIPGDALSYLPSDLHLAYAKDVHLAGLSLSKVIGGVSVGAELVHRWNTALATNANFGIGNSEGARGDTTHFLVNGLYVFGEGGLGGVKLYDTAAATVELAYSRWDRVTRNKAMFNAVGQAACQRNAGSAPGSGDKWDGCATKDNVTLAAKFEPTIYQVIDGVDLKIPMTVSVGLYGNSAVAFGGNELAGNYSVGLSADIRNRYSLDLAYTDYFQKYRSDNGVYVTSSNGGGSLLSDRGWVSLTFKTTF